MRTWTEMTPTEQAALTANGWTPASWEQLGALRPADAAVAERIQRQWADARQAEVLTVALQVAREAERAAQPETDADRAMAARDRASAEAAWRNDSGDGAEIFDDE